MRKIFFSDMIKYLPSQVVPAIVGFFSIPILTRLFSPQEYGNYSLTLTTIMILTTLMGWLPISIIRYYPAYEQTENINNFYGSIINLSVLSVAILAASSLLVLFFFKPFLASDLYRLNVIGIGVMIVASFYETFLLLLRSKRMAGMYSLFASWKSIGSIGIGLLLIFYLDRKVDFLLWGTILSMSICLTFLWKKAIGVISLFDFKIDFSLTRQLAQYSFPLVVGNLAAWVLSLSDRYLLQIFRGAYEVGIYSAVCTISERSIMFLVQIVYLAAGPIAMEMWEKEGEEKSKEFRTELVRYFLLISIPAVVGLCVLAKPIITFLTGQHYLEGYKILPFIAIGAFLFGLQGHYQIGFLYHQKTGYITFLIIITAAFQLILNLLLIPRGGYMAAAFTTMISYAFLLLLMIIVSRRFFVWKFPLSTLWKVSVASIAMGLSVYCLFNVLSYSLIIKTVSVLCAGIVIYIVLLFIMNEFQANEIKSLLNKLSKK